LNAWNFIACAYDANINTISFSQVMGSNISMVVNDNQFQKINLNFSDVKFTSDISYFFISNISTAFVFRNLAIFNLYKNPSAIIANRRNQFKNTLMYMDPQRQLDAGYSSGYTEIGYALQDFLPMKMTNGYGVYDYSWSAIYGGDKASPYNSYKTFPTATFATSTNANRDMQAINNFGYFTEYYEELANYPVIDPSGNNRFPIKRKQVSNIDYNSKPFTLCYGDMIYIPSNNSCKNTKYKEYLQNIVSSTQDSSSISISNFKLSDKSFSNINTNVMKDGSFTITFWAKFDTNAVTNLNGVKISFGDFVSAGMTVETSGSTKVIREYLFFWPNSYNDSINVQKYQKVYSDLTITTITDVWIYYIATTNHYQNLIYLTENFTKFALFANYEAVTFTGNFKIQPKKYNSSDFVFLKELRFFSTYGNFMHKLRNYETYNHALLYLYLPFDNPFPIDYSSMNYAVTTDSSINDYRKSASLNGYIPSPSTTKQDPFYKCGINEIWFDTCTCKLFF
jgi:hypothetical protein